MTAPRIVMPGVALAVALLAGCSSSTEERPRPATSSSPSPAPPSSGTPSEAPRRQGSAVWRGPSLQGMSSSDWDVEVVADSLRYPWEVRESRGTFVITEAGGTIVMISGDVITRYEVETSQPVAHVGGSGLLGLALASDFPRSGTAYAYYTYEAGGSLVNRVVELGFEDDEWVERRIVLDGIPGHELYNGGRVALGPDGDLYVTTGWVHDPERPQDLDDLAGKILRIDTDGRAVPDNPFPGSPVYSYGHRNPQGLAWDDRGRLFSAEHGEIGHDEINLIVPGGNYGWPLVEGDETAEDTQAPYLHSGNDSWAPSGVSFAGDDLLVSGLGGRVLYVMDSDGRRLSGIFSSEERVRTALPLGDDIYVTTTNTSPRGGGEEIPDRLLRLTPSR